MLSQCARSIRRLGTEQGELSKSTCQLYLSKWHQIKTHLCLVGNKPNCYVERPPLYVSKSMAKVSKYHVKCC